MKRFAQPSPGPWWLRAGNGCVQVSDGPTIDKVIAIVTTCDSVGVANARLICAAPDLLNMLQRVVDECRMVDMDARSVCPVTMEHAMQALAKVRGDAPVIEDDTPAWAAERRIQCHADGEGRWFAVPEGKTWGIQGPDGGGPEAALRRFRELNPDYDPPETPQAAPDPVAVLRRILRWYRETADGEMPAEIHNDACRSVGEEAVPAQRKERGDA